MRIQTIGTGAMSSMTPPQAAVGMRRHSNNPKTHILKVFCACSSAESGWESWEHGGAEVPVPPGSWLGADGCLSPRVSGCCVHLLIQPLPFLPQPT